MYCGDKDGVSVWVGGMVCVLICKCVDVGVSVLVTTGDLVLDVVSVSDGVSVGVCVVDTLGVGDAVPVNVGANNTDTDDVTVGVGVSDMMAVLV